MWELVRKGVLEESGMVVAGLGFLGLVLILVFHRRGERPWLWAGLICWGLAGVAGVMGYLIDTETERLEKWTRRLVEQTSPLDRRGLEEMLGERFVLTGPWGQVWLEREETMRVLEQALRVHPIREQRVRKVQVERLEGDRAEVFFDLVSVFEEGERGVWTTWRVFWRRQGQKGAWKLAEARWLTLEGREPPAGVWNW